MIQLISIVLGLLVVLIVLVDAVMTTLTVSAAAGPLTSKVLPLLWGLLLRLAPDARSRLLGLGGALLLLVTVLVWVAGLWLGWWLVFLGADTIRQATTGRPAGALDVGYFSGMTVVTLGTGDFVASTSGWRFISAVASFTGLFLVTLAITYLVSVVSAVVARRSLAIQIRGLGQSAEGIVTRAWTGSGFSSTFEQQLINLTPMVATAAEHHLAYPVLHYFHSTDRDLSAPLAVASLADALLIVGDVAAREVRSDPSTVTALRHAVERYVDAAAEVAWLPEVLPPPPPSTSQLEHIGIPLADHPSRTRAVRAASGRRKTLHQLVVSDAWSWQEESSQAG